MDLVQQ